MKSKLIFYLAVYSFLQQYSFCQNKTLENLLETNLLELSDESFENSWLNKKNKKFITFSGQLKNIQISSNWKTKQGKIDTLNLSFGNLFDKKLGYSYWSKISTSVYHSLIETLGPPIEFNIDDQMVVRAVWKKEKLFIHFTAAVQVSKFGAGMCYINFSSKRPVNKKFSRFYISDYANQIFKNHLFSQLEIISPQNDTNIKEALAKEALYKKEVLIPQQNVKWFYRKSEKKNQNFISPSQLKLTIILPEGVNEGKPDKNGNYDYWVFAKGLLRESGKIKIQDKVQSELNSYQYYYDLARAPKFILYKENGYQQSYWIEYNKEGYLSRIRILRDNKYFGSYLIKANELYKNFIIAYYDEQNTAKFFRAQIGNISFLNDHFRNELIEDKLSPLTWNSIKKHYSKYSLLMPLPNQVENDTYKPLDSYSHKQLNPAIKIFTKIVLGVSTYLDFQKEVKMKNKLAPQTLFKDPSLYIAEINKPVARYFPLAVTQIGKSAIKVIDQNRKYSVIKLHSIHANRYQLRSIINEEIQFKDIKTGIIFKLKPKKALYLGTFASIKYGRHIHKVKDGDAFFGNKINFIKNDVLINDTKVNLKWQFIPPDKEKTSTHKLNNCACFKGEKYLVNISAAKRNYMDPCQADFSKLPKNMKYLLQNCFVKLYRVAKEPNKGYVFRSATTFEVKDNKIEIIPNSFYMSDRKYSLKINDGNLFIDNQEILIMKTFMGFTHGVKYPTGEYAIISFLPKNIEALKELITDYTIHDSEGNRHQSDFYDFSVKDRVTKINGKSVRIKFNFVINVQRSEIDIDGNIFSISFDNGKVKFNDANNNTYYLEYSKVLMPIE